MFPFFADAHNLEAITPGWLGFQVARPPAVPMHPDALISYRLRLHGVPIRWTTRIAVWEPPERFVDVQVRGPYALWHHTHIFERDGDGTRVRDVVRYGLPLGPLGELAHRLFVRRDVERIFAFRRRAIESVFTSQSKV